MRHPKGAYASPSQSNLPSVPRPAFAPTVAGPMAGSLVRGDLEEDDLDASPLALYAPHFFPDLSDFGHMHAANAVVMTMHADAAAKHAAALGHIVHVLHAEVHALQSKVVELEQWKQSTLDDMNRLRFEHKLLRRRLGAEVDPDAAPLPQKAKSLPHLTGDVAVVDSAMGRRGKVVPAVAAIWGPPPGLDVVAGVLSQASASKAVQFEPEAPALVAAAGSVGGAAVAAAAGPGAMEVLERDFPVTRSTASHVTEAPDEGLTDGLVVSRGLVDGTDAELAHWRISNLSNKLRGCMGRALVSSPFAMFGLQDLRLMILPDGKEVAKGPRSRRQKELYTKKVTEGPLEGGLKLKVSDCPAPHILEYYLKVGTVRQGPFAHNFSENTVHGCVDFGIDWLREVDSDQSLTVTLLLLSRGAAAAAVAPASSAGAVGS